MKNRRKIKKKQIKAWKNQKVNIRELEKLVKKEQRRKYKAEVKEGERVASSSTIEKIKNLMYLVVNSDSSETTGSSYKMEGYDLIGKTGTAQIANPNTGKYYDGKYDYITELAVECSSKRLYPDYISAKEMRKIYEGNVFSPMGQGTAHVKPCELLCA